MDEYLTNPITGRQILFGKYTYKTLYELGALEKDINVDDYKITINGKEYPIYSEICMNKDPVKTLRRLSQLIKNKF